MRNQKRSEWIVIALLIMAVALTLSSAMAASFINQDEAGFNTGTYTNTFYNTSSFVQLNYSYNGTYLSQIFDAGSISTWNTISWEASAQNYRHLFVIDGQKYVFSSLDGTNWTTKSIDYGGTTNPSGLVSISTGMLILLDGKGIFSSSDTGASWTEINDSFTSYTHNGFVMAADGDDNLYIIDGNQRVFKSTDFGHTWTEVNNNFNGAVSNDVKGLTADSSNNLFAVDGAGGVYSSSDSGVTWTYLSDYGGGPYTDGIAADQNDYLYILLDKDVYTSTNSGLDWIKVNDRFTNYSNNGLLLFFDKKDSLIVIDGVGRTFKSSNLGLSWIELGDSNGAATNDPKAGAAAIYNTSMNILARSCNDAACDTGIFADISDVSPQILSLADNRYFQYISEFKTNNRDYTPKLYNITIDYTPCAESWTAYYTACNTSDQKIKYYVDENSCGTTGNLSADNGTVEPCDYCAPDWIPFNTSCDISDNLTQYYADANNCYLQTNLESDNNLPANETFTCDYCSENVIGPFNTSCENNQIIQYYTDSNYAACCEVTSLGSDCHIANSSYNNQTFACDTESNPSPSGGSSGGGSRIYHEEPIIITSPPEQEEETEPEITETPNEQPEEQMINEPAILEPVQEELSQVLSSNKTITLNPITGFLTQNALMIKTGAMHIYTTLAHDTANMIVVAGIVSIAAISIIFINYPSFFRKRK